MALVLFELDGNVNNEDCFQLEFSVDGQSIHVYAQVPEEMRNAGSLIGNKHTMVSQDADCVLLEGVINNRLEYAKPDDSGRLWELRKKIDLPFKCHRQLFNKHLDPIDSYLLRKNNFGYAWGYFWVISQHVGKTVAPLSTIRGKASSVSSDDNDRSCLSDEDMSIDHSINDSIKSNQKKIQRLLWINNKKKVLIIAITKMRKCKYVIKSSYKRMKFQICVMKMQHL